MSALLLLFACLLLGALVARYAKPPAGIVHGINWWVINIALPALVLALVPRLKIDTQLWFPWRRCGWFSLVHGCCLPH
jgi:predicted permease